MYQSDHPEGSPTLLYQLLLSKPLGESCKGGITGTCYRNKPSFFNPKKPPP